MSAKVATVLTASRRPVEKSRLPFSMSMYELAERKWSRLVKCI